MREEKALVNLSARLIVVWLVVLCGIIGTTVLATAHYVFDTSVLSVVALWAIRLVVLASFWLLDLSKDTKIFGIGLILLSLVLDVLLKLPVLGAVQYADWFLVSALDVTGAYAGYFTVWGLLLPVLSMTGWFILRQRKLAGWLVGLAATVGMGFAAQSVAQSAAGTFTLFVTVTVARYIVPALLAAVADLIAARFTGPKRITG
ncbi:hypothetical protein [Glutamicibacter sp. NPDC087344]|uniref:hypothetical protein n=1 Tax=Glutamicibacter sp. NPDC087344 TaxID=3363994 RepID=UPI0037F7778F